MHEVGRREFKVESVGRMKLGKRENSEKNARNADFLIIIAPLVTPRLELRIFVRTDEWLKHSGAGTVWMAGRTWYVRGTCPKMT